MKKYILTFLIVGILSACSQEKIQSNFGAQVDSTGAVLVSQLIEEMGNAPKLDIKVKGKIVEVCQEMGCWLKMDLGNGEFLMVNFHDQDFTIPKESQGKEVIVDGTVVNSESRGPEAKSELVMEAKGILFL